MKVQIDINEKYSGLQVNVCNNRMTRETAEIFATLSAIVSKEITAFDELEDSEKQVRLLPAKIIRFYAENKHVYAECENGRFRIRKRLYEIEEEFPAGQFVRISNSEIVNVKRIKSLDTGSVGIIHMTLEGGIETFVSRRYVPKIRKSLGL